MKRSHIVWLSLLLGFLFTGLGQARDTVFLKTGRVLNGKVKEGTAERGGDFILLTTESGAIYKLDKGDIVKSIIKREQVDLDYEAKLRHVRNVATDHIELAKWCEKQSRGKTRFREQIRWHYENVVRLDPDHSNARKALGYLQLKNGTWVAEADFRERQGYMPDRRDWVSGLGKQVKESDDRAQAIVDGKKKEFNRWLKRAKKGDYQPAVLAKICDQSSLLFVYDSVIKVADDVELARVHLDAISQVKNTTAIRILSQFAMMAPDQELREHAIALLTQPGIDHATAVRALSEGLKFSTRKTVQNAAFAIGEVASNDESSAAAVAALLPLTEALITTHTEKIEGALEAGRLNPSFGTGGTGLRTGGGPQTKQVKYKNRESLDALRKLVEVNFEYNEQAWTDWYIENYTLSNIDVRADN